MKKGIDSALKEVVKSCGLDTSETEMYLALLTLGKGTVPQAAKEVGLNRTSSYAVADRLKSKGVVSRVKISGVMYLRPISPKRLLQKQKESYQTLEEHIDELNYLFAAAKKDPSAQLYEGKDGLKAVLDMVLDEAKDIVIFGDGDAFKKAAPGRSENFSKMRIQRNIRSRVILKGSDAVITAVRKRKMSQDKKGGLTKIRVLPEGYNIVGGFDVFNDKVVFYSFDESSIAVVVESAVISGMMRSIFEMLWSMAETYDRTLLR